MKQSIETIHLYHTNDIHSHFENWPRISQLLKERRTHHQSAGEACYVFDVGDHVDRSHPFTEGTEGKGNVMLLNDANYDAVTIGNNEGITMSKKALTSLYDEAEFDVILANLFDEDGSQPDWAVPYKIYTTDRGTKIGVIAATAEYTEFYNKLGWQIKEPRTELKRVADSLVEKTDLLICLSHMGLPQDEQLAAECSAFNVIFGAHTHHLFEEGKLIGNTLLAATGKFGAFTGHVTIQIDTDAKEVVELSAVVYPTDSLPVSEQVNQKVKMLMEAGIETMEDPVFYNPTVMPKNLFGPSALAAFFGEALLAHTEADCALFNSGIFLEDLEEGWVTKRDLHSMLPHPINPCKIMLTGAELEEIFKLSLNKEWPYIKIKGLGFRGDLMGAMLYEKIEMDKNGQVFIVNHPIQAKKEYTLATLDMFTFGFFFPSLKHAKKEYYMPELIRDVVSTFGKRLGKE